MGPKHMIIAIILPSFLKTNNNKKLSLCKNVFPEFFEILQLHSPHFINEGPEAQKN